MDGSVSILYKEILWNRKQENGASPTKNALIAIDPKDFLNDNTVNMEEPEENEHLGKNVLHYVLDRTFTVPRLFDSVHGQMVQADRRRCAGLFQSTLLRNQESCLLFPFFHGAAHTLWIYFYGFVLGPRNVLVRSDHFFRRILNDGINVDGFQKCSYTNTGFGLVAFTDFNGF